MTEHTNTINTSGTAGTADATEAEIARIRAGRLDDAHLAWFIAESECERALRAWRAGDDADIAYCSYLAALNREDRRPGTSSGCGRQASRGPGRSCSACRTSSTDRPVSGPCANDSDRQCNHLDPASGEAVGMPTSS